VKVISYSAHNVLRLKDITFNLEGRHLFLVGGKNEQGKTSALMALLMSLCGRKGMDNYPEIALKEGENEGWVKVQLSGEEELHEPIGLSVELRLKRQRDRSVVEEFRITDSAGDEAPEPRTLLKRLYEVRAFDPLAFEKLDRKGKVELLRKLLGLDFTAEDTEYQKAYSERTEVNRDGKALKAKFDGMKHHDDAPAEEVSTSVLMTELERRQQVNQANRKQREACEQAKRLALSCSEALVKAHQDLVEAQRKFKVAEKARESAIESAEAQAQEAIIGTIVDESEKEIREQITGADALNAKVRENRKYAEAKADLDSLRDRSQALSDQLVKITETKARKLQEAKWPVPGLSIDDQGVLLNGLPFEQASKSKRVIASTEIGMALNPKLRLLVSESGGDLDNETIADLDKLLAEKGFQMIVELVTRSPGDEALCAVLIQDGQVKGQDVAEAA
jgi:hypothetical protein